MKYYILTNDKKQVLTKQGSYSTEVRVPRLYKTIAQAERFAKKFAAAIYTVHGPEVVGAGYSAYEAVAADAKALGLCINGFSHY